MEGLARESAGVWLAGTSGLGLQEHRGSAKADSKPSTKDDM